MYRNAKAEMVRSGITLATLAEKLGGTVGTWSLRLNGKADITLKMAKRFKELVRSELTLEELFREFEGDG